jgi:GON domain
MKQWVLVILAGCGTVPTNQPDARADDDAAPSDAALVLDRNCREVKARLGLATDGVHAIDPDLDGPAAPFAVFCANMATPAPVEYLELARRSLPADRPAVNFASYATGAVHGLWQCDCGVLTTLYAKLRIDPVTLVVDTADRAFAVYSDSTDAACLQASAGCPAPNPYALASSCVTNLDASGTANVDLRDTGFHVAAGTSEAPIFALAGFTPAGTVELDATRHVANLTGGGDCGGFGAQGALPLARD